MPGLNRLVELALAGEQIQIRNGNGIVELRPTQVQDGGRLPPREALRRLQAEARLTTVETEQYLREVREERLAAEKGPPE